MRRLLAVAVLLLSACDGNGDRTRGIHVPPLVSPENFSFSDVGWNDADDFDFDGDGIADRFVRRGDFEFKVVSGADETLIYQQLPIATDPGRRLLFRDFSIIQLNGRPSVVMAAHYVPSDAVFPRYSAPLHILYNDGESLTLRTYSEYRGGFFSVACTTSTHSSRPGAFCFLGSYGTEQLAKSALVHVAPDGSIDDVTAAAGLPWVGGFDGTDLTHFERPNANFCTNPGSREKWHVMGVGWIDFDQDGRTDLIVAGQHMRVFAYRQIAADNEIGFRVIEYPASPGPGEDLVVSSEPAHIDGGSHCAYVSTETECGDRDRLICYEGEQWVRRELPIAINQNISPVEIRVQGGKLHFRANDRGNVYVFSYPRADRPDLPRIVECAKERIGGDPCA
uniref:FG-GAP repeat protein n=1 Tax=Chromera velia CCMP2878 TaxID=1169474 RepID=A0A0G4I2T8_9ALVE|eukprot:Cvel_35189.t1-p1 / transcript=Cvel_35189.t1 / gene=Cvel_35189 / organism=Chromera_velia_CCMP2878 / gene_product=hypothetical protein / transcript_product=hypothetical protein / location=Cvel_scaffold6331:1640-2815(+) / protein_length=392 / sequence_SO=supercontig / SO=protein_coding / is_pseudo=false